MKTKPFKGIISTLFAITLLYSCNEREASEPEIPYTDNIELGEMHNEIVLDFLINFESSEFSNGRTLESARVSDMVAYLDTKYDIDIMSSQNFIFKDLQSTSNDMRTLSEEFDPFQYLEDNKDLLNEYFYNKLLDLMTFTLEYEDSPGIVAGIISDFQNGVLNDDNFSQEEKQHFLNMLDVYIASLELWTYVDSEWQNSDSRSSSYCRANAWQIPTADWIGGIAGALGGPLGAAGGMAASSLIHAMSVCFSSTSISTPPPSVNSCTNNYFCIPGVSIVRLPTVTSFYTLSLSCC